MRGRGEKGPPGRAFFPSTVFSADACLSSPDSAILFPERIESGKEKTRPMQPVPPVRPIEAIPVESEGNQLVVLRDPWRFIDGNMTVTLPAYLLMTLMNGERTIPDIQAAFESEFKGRVAAADVEQFVRELDENGLFLNERFEAIRNEALESFARSPIREAAHAGGAYAADPEALRRELDGYYEAMRQGREGAVLKVADAPINGRSLRGVVAPHIDPRVGGPVAAAAFEALRASGRKPDLFVIFGTAHQPGGGLFTLTDKDFRTPLGTVETDRELVEALNGRYSADLKRGEYLHKNEHSIEFQVIFLQHLFGPNHSFKILPVLVGSFHEYLDENVIPSSEPEFADFGRALREAIQQCGRDACMVAGADLSHIGRKFGDDEDLSDELVQGSRVKDLEMLEHLRRGDREGFFRHLQVDGDKQKVCGLPPIYAMLDALEEDIPAVLLDYDLNIEEATQSFVSYASLAFYS
jgi:AmmeMemoRadiSam system protein B